VEGATHNPACFTVRQDDSAGIGATVVAECKPLPASPIASEIPATSTPRTAAEAVGDAIKLAVDEGDLELAGELLAVAKKTRKPAPVADLAVVRARRDGDGGKT
jgi:hypothetical protein